MMSVFEKGVSFSIASPGKALLVPPRYEQGARQYFEALVC